ncbi:MAG: Tn7 transposase TnsA N-terminal domain-containing protein [Sulfuricaulis sp.]
MSAPGKGPARAIIEQSPHRMVGAIHYAGLTVYPAEWESPLERQLIYMALMCHDVSAIEAQPEELSYDDEDDVHTYTPDVAITVSRGRIYVEDKPLRCLIREENLAKYAAIARSLRAQGKRLEFITEYQLPPAFCKNASLLRRYLMPDRPVQAPACVVDTLQDGPRTFDALITELGSAVTLVDLYTLVAHRLLCIDWNERLGRRARVSLPDKPHSFARLTYDAISASGRFADLVAQLALGNRPTNQQLLAASCARRQPLSVASPFGFVDGLSQWQLGHLERQHSARTMPHAGLTIAGDGTRNQSPSQPTEDN